MVTVLRVLRIIFGVIGVWQIIGLFPVLTWINNPKAITLEMAVGVLFKGVIAVVCVGAYYWLGRLKSRHGPRQEKIGDAVIAGIVLAGGVCVVLVAALLIPSSRKAVPLPDAAPSRAIASTQPSQQRDVPALGSYASKKWTQDSTGAEHLQSNSTKFQCEGTYTDYDIETSQGIQVSGVYVKISDNEVEISGSPGFDADYQIITRLEKGVGFQLTSNQEYGGFINRMDGSLDLMQKNGPINSDGSFKLHKIMQLACHKASALF